MSGGKIKSLSKISTEDSYSTSFSAFAFDELSAEPLGVNRFAVDGCVSHELCRFRELAMFVMLERRAFYPNTSSSIAPLYLSPILRLSSSRWIESGIRFSLDDTRPLSGSRDIEMLSMLVAVVIGLVQMFGSV